MPKVQTIGKVETTSRLEQLTGPGQGNVFDVYKEKMSIGRNEENEVVLVHESVSRTHAYIEKNGDLGYLIFDNESKNGLYVNGARVEGSPLKNGDLIQVGIFEFKYHAPEAEPVVQKSPLPQLAAVPSPSEFLAKFFPKKEGASQPAGNNKRLMLYGAVGLLLLMVVMYKPDETPKADEKSKGANAAADFAKRPDTPAVAKKAGGDPTLEDPLESTSKILTNPDLKDTGILSAEQYFRMGLREYSNKNYQRAIDNFRSALTLSARHPLAQFYLDLAVHETEAAAKRDRDLAIQYYQIMQYDRAIYFCKEVIAYLQHNPNHPSAKSCKDFIENARLLKESAELAP